MSNKYTAGMNEEQARRYVASLPNPTVEEIAEIMESVGYRERMNTDEKRAHIISSIRSHGEIGKTSLSKEIGIASKEYFTLVNAMIEDGTIMVRKKNRLQILVVA